MLTVKMFLSLAYVIHFLKGNVEAAAAARKGRNGTAGPTHSSFHIGVILDSSSSMGTMADLCISMALSDFYSAHPDYQTRLLLHTRDAKDQLDVTSAALELMQNDKVHGIIGQQMLREDTFVVELGGKVHVPVISFTARSQSSSHTQNPYFIRTTPDDSNQAKALAVIFQGFEWHEAVILYEDTDYGNQFPSKINRAFEDVDIRVAYMIGISTSAEDHDIVKELKKLIRVQTRVFLVHMNVALGIRLFHYAKQVGMMSEGYAWLITDNLGNFVNSMESEAIDSMEGVLGLRPYVPDSKNLDNFRARWKKNMFLMKPESTIVRELNVYGLWAYDTVWALAMAVEKIGPVKPAFLKVNHSKSGSDISNLRISEFGPKLLSQLQHTKFEGLSGDFYLIDGQQKPPALEIFNVIGTGGRTIGYWTPEGGITRKLALTGGLKYSTSTKKLKSIVWPGDSVKQPKGWNIPATGKLKIGIPLKSGFNEFLNISKDPKTNLYNVTGFTIDIFLSALKLLPFDVDYEFIPFINENGTSKGAYNDLLHEISYKTYDIVVGDATILADRARYVDFTLPYSESGLVMVAKNRKEKDMWIFIKPFRWDLWLAVFSACVLIGLALRILENRVQNNSDSVRQRRQQLGLLFWFPIAVLAFPERNMVASNWARFVLVIWLFMAFILMQSYTANLSAMFTVDQLDFSISQDHCVGYQEGSFAKDFLINRLHFSESKIKNYATVEEYHDAMSKGSKNGGIDAIFDETPYMKLFLNRYNSKYKMVGPRYRTDGFGFAFPLGSPLVVHFSRAILAVTEAANMTTIEQKNFGPTYSSGNQLDSIKTQSPALTGYNFGGLFIIIGSAMLFALFCSECPYGRSLTEMATHCCHICFLFLPFRRNDSRIHSIDRTDSSGGSSGSENVDDRRSGQVNASDSFGSDTGDDQSGQNSLIELARQHHVNESSQRNSIDEIQQSETRHYDVSARHQFIS